MTSTNSSDSEYLPLTGLRHSNGRFRPIPAVRDRLESLRPTRPHILALGAPNMLHVIWDWAKFNFWSGLVCLAAGVVVFLPLMLSKPLRERFFRSNIDIETIGGIALLFTLLVIGLYNHYGAHGV